MFPGLTQQVEQGLEMVSQTMPAPVEATFCEDVRNTQLFAESSALFHDSRQRKGQPRDLWSLFRHRVSDIEDLRHDL